MAAIAGVVLLWIGFGGLHLGLAAGPVRRPVVARVGEGGFTVLFSLLAAASFAALVHFYAGHRFDGPPGLALGEVAPLRWVLIVVIGAGVALMAAALSVYPALPSALFADLVRPPRGIERVTRHPFFVGLALLSVAHVLLATRLVGAIFLGGFALLALLGAWHQDAKLRQRRGRPYADYCARTSIVPFAAILAGRQRLVWRELPFGALAAGLAATAALRRVHGALFDDGGSRIIAAVLAGAALASFQAWRRAHRTGERSAVPTRP